MDDVREDLLGPSHGTTPATVIANKKVRSFESTELINEKGDGPYRGCGYLSLFSDPVDWQHGAKKIYCYFATLNRIVHTKTIIIQMWQNISNVG